MPAGRPRTFDREQALHRAMLIFWEKGYEGTSMNELIETIGVKAPSVYAAFGNKDAIFNEVVKHYENMVKEGPLKILAETKPVEKALEAFFKFNIDTFTNQNNPSSCLIVTAAMNCAPENRAHIATLQALRASFKSALETRFKVALSDGELVEGSSPGLLAEYYTTFLNGLAIRSRDGASKKDLKASFEFAKSTLESMLTPPAS